MLHPSYTDLMKVVNAGVEDGEEPVVSSRYSIVMATSKRARQIIAGDEPLIENSAGKKPLAGKRKTGSGISLFSMEPGMEERIPCDEGIVYFPGM